MDTTLIDDIVFKCLFHRRFMDFNLCARLESVSTSFLNHAHLFYKQMESLNFKHRLLKENTTSCARKLALRCPNITKIQNISVKDDSLEENIVNFCFISKMRNVSLVGIDFQHFSPNVLLPLGDMPNLSSLKIATHRADSDEITFEESMVQKLNVTSLECDRLSLLEFCSADSLEILNLSVNYSTEIDELIEKLKRYRKLREISIDFYYGVEPEELLRIVDFIYETVHIKKFFLAVQLDYSVKELPELAKHHRFRQLLDRLEIVGENMVLGRVEMLMDIILKLSNLTSLTLYNVDEIHIDVLLNSLPNLQNLFLSSDCCTDEHGASIVVETTYNR